MSDEGFENLARKMKWLTGAVLVLVLIYVGWIFFSRRQEERDAAAKEAAREAADAQFTIDKYGGGRAKVLAFSASSGDIRRGQKVQLCYGVANAKTVKIDPPVGDVWPSMTRCLEIEPKKDTQYTITAQDAEGHTDTAQLAIHVR